MTRRSYALALLAGAALYFFSCSDPVSPGSAQYLSLTGNVRPKPRQEVIFNSGRGTGQYDAMTYAEFKSELLLIPDSDMVVIQIRPQIWYCNGTSGFLVHIRDEHYRPLAAEAGLVDGKGEMTPTFEDRMLDSTVTLSAGEKYLIVMKVWTTKSVGIFTTGSRQTGTVGYAHYEVRYAKSDTWDHLDRGAIAFELLARRQNGKKFHGTQ